MTRLHFIGGEKGGVGKSVLSRVLAQYLIDREQPFSVFDADRSHAAMLRYYRDYSSPVNMSRFSSADSIMEPAIQQGRQVIVDLPAQSREHLSKWMNDSGVIELGQEMNMPVTLWHVMDDGMDSVRLLGSLVEAFGPAPDYVLVRNLGRGEDFTPFDQSEEKERAIQVGARNMELPALHAPLMRKIDRIDASFWAAANNQNADLGPCLNLLERQRVKIWLGKCYSALDTLSEAWSAGNA